MRIDDETIEQFPALFKSVRGFNAMPLQNTKNGNGKVKFTYSAITGHIKLQNYRNHFQTASGLTPSPIVDQEYCWWGAIDVDDYDLGITGKVELIIKAKDFNLIACESKSGGLHFYCFAKEPVLCKRMRGFLRYVRKQLRLNPKTEIFPKQDYVNENEYGNGITLPYRSYNIDPQNSPCALVVYRDKVVPITPEQFIVNAKNCAYSGSHFVNYDPDDLEEDTIDKVEQELEDDNEDSILNPETQKLTAKEIYRQIVDEKMSLDDDSYFDDMITLYVAKQIVSMKTDEEILTLLLRLKDTGADETYYEKKINRARIKFKIEDPEVARMELLKNVIYIKQRDKFYDLTTNEEYDKSAINFTYARLFQKESASQFIMKNARRIVVEDWIYDPKGYDPKQRLIEVEKKLYLNSYVPSDLVAEIGDITYWDQLLDHYFNDNQKYKEHFLDWLAYMVQHPGEKIRHACILVSTQFQVGKGSIWRAIKLMFGSHNAKEIDVGQALDKSKGYLTNSQIVLIDEMQSAGKFDEKTALLNNLKRIITEENISSRALYVDYKIVKSCTNYLLFTNHKDALSLPPNEVRYWVYISEQSRMNDEFYSAYHSWLDNGGTKAILHHLKERIISDDFKPKGVAPDTPFRSQMSKGGEHPLTKIIRQLYEEQDYPFREAQTIIGSTELYNILRSKGMLRNGRINDVAMALEQIGGRNLGQCRVSMDKKITKPTLYLIRDHDKHFGKKPQEIVDEYYFPVVPENTNDGGHF